MRGKPVALQEDFSEGIGAHWQQAQVRRGTLEPTGTSVRFVNSETSGRSYSNAQIDDYIRLATRNDFLWRPPLTLTVRARFSDPPAGPSGPGGLRGTAGFGFWNDPFMMSGARVPALPRAIWFFYASPPSNMKLHSDVPGCGWKAAVVDAQRLSAIPWAAAAPLLIPLMNLRPVYRAAWPRIQRALHVCEAIVQADMTAWHTYVIEWDSDAARFLVDGQSVLECDTAPRGPLGLVLWLDNQYLIATPWGRLGYGVLASPGRHWMEVASVDIVPET